MSSVWSHIRGQSNLSNHPVPRSTTQAQYYLNHFYRETAALTQNLILQGILWDWAQPTRRRVARAFAPRFQWNLVLNVIFRHDTNLSLSITDQFSTVCWRLAQMMYLKTMLRSSILWTRVLNSQCLFDHRHVYSMGVVTSVRFAWHHASFWEQSEVGNSKMAISWESWIRCVLMNRGPV